MSFLKLLASVFKKDTEAKKSNFREHIQSVSLPTTAQEANKQKAIYVMDAARDTLELCTGIPDEIKKALVNNFYKIGFYTTADSSEARDELYKLLDGLNWTWKEWEYWRPIVIELGTMTTGMSIYCHPEADKINWPQARSKYSPEKIFNLMTLKDIKTKLVNNVEVQQMKRAELIEYLKNNESAWFSLIDPHIQAQWDKKKHNEGPTPRRIFNLMCHTIQSRASDLETWRIAMQSKHDTRCSAVEQELLWETVKRKKIPWYKSYGPAVPGMILIRKILY